MTMKKIIFIAISALTALLVSCDMEKLPYSAIEESIAVQTMDDATNLRVSIYSPTKSMFGGARWDIEEMRGGLFNAKADFGNYYGLFYAWIMKSGDSDVSGPWYSDYSIIASMNFAIGAFEKLQAAGNLSKKDKETLDLYIAEAYMTRVMAYWDLVTKYCVAYNPDATDPKYLPETAYGLPLVDEYAPTADRSKYPGRSTLEETYQFILNDLDKASAITTEGKANSKYWTIDAVNAMRARVLLNMKNYEEAEYIALELINSGNYELASDKTAMANMWGADSSKELLFVSAGSYNDQPTSTGSYYIYDNSSGDGSTPNPQYIPSKTLIEYYGATADDRKKDRRYEVYFQTRPINVEGVAKADVEVFFKYVGNPVYRAKEDQINYRSAGKPFRIAEMYLTLAECYAGLTDYSNAAKWLNALRDTRIENNTPLPGTAAIMTSIKEEWTREFVGEGFRMINVKRWNDGVKRGVSQNSKMTKSGDEYDGLQTEAYHTCAIWPIPKEEIDANPQIKNQQNEGY